MAARHQETITRLEGELAVQRDQQARIDQTISALNEHQSRIDRTIFEMIAKHEQDMGDVKGMLQHLLAHDVVKAHASSNSAQPKFSTSDQGAQNDFTRAICTRFGATEFEKPGEVLSKLHQKGLVQDFQNEFERLANLMVGLPESYMIDCFVSGLKDEIRFEVKLLRPESLIQATSLAGMVEDKVVSSQNAGRSNMGYFNIHNICIYDNQDVYANFSLNYNPNRTLSTRTVNCGGKNPEFNENLGMKITHFDAVLKCEIWRFSRARNLMEDQLLGFTLVPVSLVVRKGKVTQDFTLSSTYLFHIPAGTVQLTLFLNTAMPVNPSAKSPNSATSSSISSEAQKIILDLVEFERIEFPDLNVARENQQMVSENFDMAEHNSARKPKENCCGTISPNGSIQNFGLFSSTTTCLSDYRNSIDSIEKMSRLAGDFSDSHAASISADANQSSRESLDTPTSKKESNGGGKKDTNFSSNGEGNVKEENLGSVKFDPVFTAPLGNINLEAEQTAMQQQIVEMYMRSMQQLTKSLAKMNLPIDLDKPELEDSGDVIQNHDNKLEL
ncbi:hypothetical protein HHK36_011744 [Tetracentron sinense]|uniref:C2 domain-containing protein n=1 Tax=Tetracentron sinense TaxID=13715 RepID=A0A834ZB04_TETSI|nr:hypothetical protein HHK36_011744 [Tetracentron sinense]